MVVTNGNVQHAARPLSQVVKIVYHIIVVNLLLFVKVNRPIAHAHCVIDGFKVYVLRACGFEFRRRLMFWGVSEAGFVLAVQRRHQTRSDGLAERQLIGVSGVVALPEVQPAPCTVASAPAGKPRVGKSLTACGGAPSRRAACAGTVNRTGRTAGIAHRPSR